MIAFGNRRCSMGRDLFPFIANDDLRYGFLRMGSNSSRGDVLALDEARKALRTSGMPPHRFPAPWTVEELEACFVVRDHNDKASAYV